MAGNKMALKDAGIREQEWAQKLVSEGFFPAGITFETLLDHGVYDPYRDVVMLTVKATVYRSKVNRP